MKRYNQKYDDDFFSGNSRPAASSRYEQEERELVYQQLKSLGINRPRFDVFIITDEGKEFVGTLQLLENQSIPAEIQVYWGGGKFLVEKYDPEYPDEITSQVFTIYEDPVTQPLKKLRFMPKFVKNDPNLHLWWAWLEMQNDREARGMAQLHADLEARQAREDPLLTMVSKLLQSYSSTIETCTTVDPSSDDEE